MLHHRFALAIGLQALLSCGAFDFDVTQAIPPQLVTGNAAAAAAGNLLSSTGLFSNPFSFDVDLQQEQKAHDTGPIDGVYMKSMTLRIDAASPAQDFDWLDELHVLLESRQDGSTLPRIEVATLAPVPRGKRELLLRVSAANLLEYVRQGTRVTSEARGRVPAADARFDGRVVFKVSPL